MDEILDIERLAYGRAGIARSEGRVIFVEDTAPGDRVRITDIRDRGSYMEASVAELVEASPARTKPPCPVQHDCGGCPWQQVSYEDQLLAKRDAVFDALTRIAKIESPLVSDTIPSPLEFGYRNRLKLRFDKGQLGFYQAKTNRLVPIPDCLLAEDSIRAALPEVEALAKAMSTRITRIEIADGGLIGGLVVSINSAGRLRRGDVFAVREFLEKTGSGVRGLLLWGRGWRREFGDLRRRLPLGDAGAFIEVTGDAFSQVNTAANNILVDQVVAAADATPRHMVLDLYAGSGNFSLPLAETAGKVVAVESSADAIESGRAAARAHQFAHLRFVEADTAAYVREHRDAGADIIITDPPRSGLRDCAREIADLQAGRCVLVSCDPSTLARDVKAFTERGYRMIQAVPVDMFPQTFHVETVCLLELT